MPGLNAVLWLAALAFTGWAQATETDQDAERYLAVEQLPALAHPALLASLSWDHGRRDRLYATVVQQRRLEDMGFRFRTLPHPGDRPLAQAKNTDDPWARFPSWEEYINLMQDYAERYPHLARLETLGFSQQGRPLLVMKISRNPDQDEAEPEVFYTSTMHVDETTGYVLLLRLMDELLENPSNDPRIDALLDGLEIWINPLANPDGAYAGGNAGVSGARRFLANGVDANRNFPDPIYGENPDGQARAPETEAMMAFAMERNFTLAANFHGGAEVFNYPWDSRPERHPDDDWFRDAGRQWADLAQQHWPGSRDYFRDLDNGITNGYDWYPVSGGRQDWMNAYAGTFEVTVELSRVKNPDPATLPDYWQANRPALLAWLERATVRIHGQVVDDKYRPIADALITLDDRDTTVAPVFSDAVTGHFFRLTTGGVRRLRITAPGYRPLETKAETGDSSHKPPLYILWPDTETEKHLHPRHHSR